jgi:hypothetical protein
MAELTMIVETGAGLPDSNSYTSLVEAENILLVKPAQYKVAWTEADDYTKTQVLMWGTQLLDDWVIWPGVQCTSGQALQNPRSGVISPSGYLLPSYTIYPFIKRANVEMAVILLGENIVEDTSNDLESLRVGPISLDFSMVASKSKNTIPLSVSSILLPYGCTIRSEGKSFYAAGYYERG